MSDDPILRLAKRGGDPPPYVTKMVRSLALRLGCYRPSAALAEQLTRSATNLAYMIVSPVKRVMVNKEETIVEDGGPGLVWNVRDDNEGDKLRRRKEPA